MRVESSALPGYRFLCLTAFVSCFCFLLAQQDTPEAQRNPLGGSAATEAGLKIYDGACQGCHGAGARGSERAPALAGGSPKHGNADGEIFQNIRAGIRGTPMPAFAQLSTDQIWQLVTYLRSLAGAGSSKETVTGNIESGRNIFETKAKCLDCHQVNGRGTPVGPDLSVAGKLPAEQIQAKILNPNQPAAGGRAGTPGRRGAEADAGAPRVAPSW